MKLDAVHLRMMVWHLHKRLLNIFMTKLVQNVILTHYHELTVLEESLNQLKNVHVSAIEENGKVVFLHKIQDGAADKSYGIHVAQLAELPDNLIARAKEVLAQLEGQEEIIIPKRVEVKVQEATPEPVVVKEEIAEIQETKVETEEESQLSFFGGEQSSKKQEKPLLDQKETAVLAQIKKSIYLI